MTAEHSHFMADDRYMGIARQLITGGSSRQVMSHLTLLSLLKTFKLLVLKIQLIVHFIVC